MQLKLGCFIYIYIYIDDTVKSDDEDEAFEPPPVFISYQWGHQQEVQLLQRHLNMAGITIILYLSQWYAHKQVSKKKRCILLLQNIPLTGDTKSGNLIGLELLTRLLRYDIVYHLSKDL